MNKVSRLLYILIAALFACYFLSVQWFNRTSYEDHEYLCQTLQLGPLGNFIYLYNTWCARWSGRVILGLLFWLASEFSVHTVLFTAHVMVFAFLITSIFNFLKSFFHKYANSTPDSITLCATSILLCSVFYYGSFSISANWYGNISAIPGLIYLSCSIILLTILFNDEPSGKGILVFMMCALVIGGGSESFSIPFAVGFLLALLWRFYKSKTKLFLFLQRRSNRLFFIGLILIGLGQLIYLTSPGASKRLMAMSRAFEQKDDALRKTTIQKFSPNWSPILLDKKNRLWLLLMIPLAFMALHSKLRIQREQFTFLIISITLSTISIYALMRFAFKGTGPPRSWFPVSILISVMVLLMVYYFLKKYYKPSFLFLGIEIIALLLVSVQFLRSMNAHLPILSAYASQYDLRIEQLKKLQQEGNTSTVLLAPLPQHVLIFSAEIKPDPQSETNKKFACSLNLGFGVGLIPEKVE